MSRRASLDLRDELMSGVSISVALSSVEWSGVECSGARWYVLAQKAAEVCRSEKDFDP